MLLPLSIFMYWCLTGVILILFIFVVSFYVYVYTSMYTYLCQCMIHLFIYIYFHLFILNFAYVYLYIYIYIFIFFELLLCELYHFSLNMFMYVGEYMLYFAFICLHVCFSCGLKNLGAKIHTWTRVQVDGIDTDKDMDEKRTKGRGMCTQNWAFLICTWYLCIHSQHRHGWILKYTPLNMESQLCQHRDQPLGAGTQRLILIGVCRIQGVITE